MGAAVQLGIGAAVKAGLGTFAYANIFSLEHALVDQLEGAIIVTPGFFRGGQFPNHHGVYKQGLILSFQQVDVIITLNPAT